MYFFAEKCFGNPPPGTIFKTKGSCEYFIHPASYSNMTYNVLMLFLAWIALIMTSSSIVWDAIFNSTWKYCLSIHFILSIVDFIKTFNTSTIEKTPRHLWFDMDANQVRKKTSHLESPRRRWMYLFHRVPCGYSFLFCTLFHALQTTVCYFRCSNFDLIVSFLSIPKQYRTSPSKFCFWLLARSFLYSSCVAPITFRRIWISLQGSQLVQELFLKVDTSST